MVDFKKLLNQRRGLIPASTQVRQRAQREQDVKKRRVDTPTQPVLETSLHREMRDPDYLRSLDRYADEHRAQ